MANTSVPFEVPAITRSLFSHAGLIITYLRNRFSPNTLETLTFLKDNMYND
jgi:hypothetical protein